MFPWKCAFTVIKEKECERTLQFIWDEKEGHLKEAELLLSEEVVSSSEGWIPLAPLSNSDASISTLETAHIASLLVSNTDWLAMVGSNNEFVCELPSRQLYFTFYLNCFC